ncbi:hypothetical protein JKF63_02094 [Porcisia hertigi]|uniref:Uncharacterized protein n=1 Tax=Porcisia hertigi TaxID=2761500 RepID=A0A836ID49_9TRYP|nr:hypothetical protein JKF63_02094 [Porcisia hertigi]
MASSASVPALQQRCLQRMWIRWVECCSSTALSCRTQRRSYASCFTGLSPSSILLDSTAPLHDTTTAVCSKTTRESFTLAFARAAADDPPKEGGCTPRLQRSANLSAWTEYLVGLRDVFPSSAVDDTPLREGGSTSKRDLSSTVGSPSAGDFAGSQDMFLHHIFDDVKEAALYATTRRPETFLRPEQVATDAALESGSQWQLMPLSAALRDMEAVLQDMLLCEQQCHVRGESTGGSLKPVVTFRRSMLEQAFLSQYCDLAAMKDSDVAAPGAPPCELQCFYPYDYSRQPKRLRRRLERGMRALLCASAYTLHIHWEQHMARHHPSDITAQVFGLEFVMLWWWANPDQMPVELSLAAARLPPPTLQFLRYQESLVEATLPGRHGDGRQAGSSPPQSLGESKRPHSVEQHLRRYLHHHFGVGSTDKCTRPLSEQQLQQHERRRTVLRDGGLLCPSAVFPPAYQDALRAHLANVQQRKNLTTCPLFPRVLEVALAVATSDPAASEDSGASSSSTHLTKRTPISAAARRGREVALQLCQDWLWPVICGRASSHPTTSVVHTLHRSGEAAAAHALLPSAPREKVEDWAVLTAAVAAVSQVRGHLLALRRASAVGAQGGPGGAQSATPSGAGGGGTEESTVVMSGKGMSLAYIREHFYKPIMRALLTHSADAPYRDGERLLEVSNATALQDMPGWVGLVFARVSACFEEAGMLQRDIARQPATPARLWCLLFHSMCDTFPNVFHSGNTVTVMWTLLALEGVCAGPSLYYSTYRVTNAGKAETMAAWLRTLATWTASGAFTADLAQVATQLSCTDEGGVARAGSLCPRAERCQRTAFLLSTAVTDTLVGDDGLKYSRAVVSPGHSRHGGGRRAKVMSLPSFASSPSPALPLHLNSAAALAQAWAHLTSCAELSDEVVTVSIEVFRRYATLPVLVPDVETSPNEPITSAASFREGQHGSHGGGPPAEAALLRPQGNPSLMVFLRFLQVVTLSGDCANAASSGSPGLVSCVVDDVLRVCHPVVAVYLRKLRVYAAAVSGRSGALALLNNEELQSALDGLPPPRGRQRLLNALLWSGLPVSALEKAVGTEVAVYGSGSLAWCVLERNQQRFLAFTPPSTSADASFDAAEVGQHKGRSSSAHAANETGIDAADVANSFTEVASRLDEILRHLWQLAISIPDTARVALCLHPYVGYHVERHGDSDTAEGSGSAVARESGEDTRMPNGFDSDGVVDDELDTALMGEGTTALPIVPAAASSEGVLDAFEYESGVVLEATEDDSLDAEVEGIDSPVDWETTTLQVNDDFDDGVTAGTTAVEDLGVPLVSASLWESRAAVRSSVSCDTTQLEGDIITAADTGEGAMTNRRDSIQDTENCSTPTYHGEHRGLAQTLLLATPAAQHIFYSLLEVLSWTVMPQSASASSTRARELVSPLGHAHLPGELGRLWLTRLAQNYSKCVSVWQVHCNLVKANAAATPGAAVLCQPQTTERIILVLLQSCPDTYFVGLLLLALTGCTRDVEHFSSNAVEAFARRVRRAGSLFPWSVESSLAQFLFHSGVTAASVRRWRVTHGLAKDLVSRHGSECVASAALQYVAHHRGVLQRLQRDAPTLDGGGNSSDAGVHIKRDLLQSMGSLLLCSLEQRGAAESPCRALYRYNAYVNEFLLHRVPLAKAGACSASSMPSPEMLVTALRVVLPSAQLTSPSPSSIPPQQVVSLRVAWKRRLGHAEKEVLRRCFRNRALCATSATAVSSPKYVTSAAMKGVEQKEEDDYAAAFL